LASSWTFACDPAAVSSRAASVPLTNLTKDESALGPVGYKGISAALLKTLNVQATKHKAKLANLVA
jgi:hypothetical protein